jgi:hypothetical protein
LAKCTACGNEDNPVDATYCRRCGARLPTAPPNGFEDSIEEFGKSMGRAGEQVGRQFQQVGREAINWWDAWFGVYGPVVAGLIGFLIVVIVTVGILALAGGRAVWVDIGTFLAHYLYLFLILAILTSYNDWARRRQVKQLRWIRPFLDAVATVISLWVAAQILDIIGRDQHVAFLRDLANGIGLFLPLLFVLIIVVGYAVLAVRLANESQNP